MGAPRSLPVCPLFFMVRALEEARFKNLSRKKHLIVEINGARDPAYMRRDLGFVMMGLVLARRAMMRGRAG